MSSGGDSGKQIANLFQNPFGSQVQSFSFYAALAYSFAGSALLFILFILLRPRISNIYAPRAKHADAKHKPPNVDKSFFGWIGPIRSVKEAELADKVGLDATIFLRFLRMLRNMFVCLSIVGCAVLIPVNLISYGSDWHSNGESSSYRLLSRQSSGYGGYGNGYSSAGDSQTVYAFIKMTPIYTAGPPLWAYVVIAYVFNLIIFFFLWWNYRAVTRLRRRYFDSSEYRYSLHSHTLLITQIPGAARNEDGVIRIVQSARATEEAPRVTVARVVRELPDLIEQHEKAVLELETHLATYLADPNKLPAKRPTCKPVKQDKNQSYGSDRVDAIDYYSSRIAYLEKEINAIRQSFDDRSSMSYGFATYTHIEDAHAVAYASRKKNTSGTIIKLAPRPHDLIWKNLPMSRAQRRTQAGWNGFWMVMLTILYIPPNVLTAVFLTNLHNLGQVWDDFQLTLEAHPVGWSIVQGILAPAIQLLFYFFLPTIFRRLLMRSGDTTKTSRERHVTSKLYAFFVFNNLFVVSVFSAVWAFVAVIIHSQKSSNEDIWDSIKSSHLAYKLALGLCQISPYWITYQLQRPIGAAIDILQAWPLVKNTFLKRFTNPTPRQLVEITAPQPFEYADYYNNYLFVATVGLAMGTLQPLMLPVTGLYIAIDSWLKKYLLQYVFITKVESGGAFWRMTFNRILFAVLLMDAVIALMVGALGIPGQMLYAMIPLLIMLPAFKWYCAKAFDTPYQFYSTRTYTETELGGRASPGLEKKLRRNQDRVAVRYGHPVLYKKLMTPMVHAKSQHLLRQIYQGRLDSDTQDTRYDNRPQSGFGFSDIYMGEMDSQRPGKLHIPGAGPQSSLPFEVVSESDLDFENFKRRQEFRNEYGGDGELYGTAGDQFSRPGTPSSMMSFGAASTLMSGRNQSPTGYSAGIRSRSGSTELLGYSSRKQSYSKLLLDAEDMGETTYSRGYAAVGPSARELSPTRGRYDYMAAGAESPDVGTPRNYSPVRPVRQPTLNAVDIPSPGLEGGAVAAAGTTAYHDSKHANMGTMGASLQGPSYIEQRQQQQQQTYSQFHQDYSRPRPTQQRKPVGSGNRHAYGGSGGSASEARSGLSTPTHIGTPQDEGNFDYDYFRRGRLG